ncbi:MULTISPECIES: PE-PGRS family protein [Streptomyces]|uniref:PE-PGRS family protein n=1 Tax=Streptomyces TaxID=1883 RepID=UPI000F656579|nr:PE-PGRS family protein [Streptomyces alboflavus]
MRNVNPDDLDQLAKLMDGKGGLADKLDEAFTRASTLGVSDKLGPIKPMRTWVTTTPPDLRKRATLVRGEQLFERGHRETYSDWLARIEAYYLAKVPGLKEIGEKDLEKFIKGVTELAGAARIGGWTMATSLIMGNVYLKNSWHSGLLRAAVASEWLNKSGTFRGFVAAGLGRISRGELRSLTAPGSWLPGKLGGLFARSTLYQRASRIPFSAGYRADLLGRGWDGFRSLPGVRAPLVARGIDFVVGSDALAARYGGYTHSGVSVTRAGQASLIRVGRSAAYFQKLSNARPSVIAAGKTASPFLKGLGAAGKTAGGIRLLGIGGGVLSTGVSAANVWAQGNPVEAFKKKGAGYVADVAEVGFNASLTAAMVAPNPFTIGATVVTGAIYGGAKVVEHWDDIKEGAGKAKDWTVDKAKDLGKGIAKSKLNPMNWKAPW